ncbi:MULTISPECIES: MBL fold metallo-hydrolase [Chryseobacterium]|uniref:Glyoxylase-like metal-dependent hydrolase (Beta-lactamase superfamily II) n=1 Tax=Chryseobacterium camelliae TaxID=1265445 RepID=A0ABU0TKL4_9FLAO|nr:MULTISPECIES: MBL fold metallo-hydrolase [Chryseobacterium]MDT3409382.1 glyoxylase-like metal-dependent hydrolase (beta-lactamase superfamily II) [Pseudacidovorax intermedius]MDQ1096753.1 glyoxylase-like metal-dependent hydrolase (beta-lactamase superfamily II) [Chryseobacterium camelliae]MDQ1100696.1 glyoxylase-like metal-dependent hydrolase (beta-lactamase superfamily II) [Chryseobacterium sp. SORGH_AS_1048]MDR6088035.1 glyoxylase-like metal-dependent hydrolase (beta-lactamase superfamily 
MQKITEDVFHIPLMPRNGINCYIIEGVLIDSGIKNSHHRIIRALKEIPVGSHALTHAHPDHQGCSDVICTEFRIPLYCHEKEVSRAESGLATVDYPSKRNIIARFQQKYWAGKGHPVTRTLRENDVLGNFTVIETPGHSSGHISFFRERDGILIIGDAATNMNLLTTCTGLHLPPGIFTSDGQANIHSLKKLKHLNPRIICFGHGPVLHNRNREFETFVDKCEYYL